MKKFISLTAAILTLSMASPAFAFGTLRGNTLTPDGFCTVHQDKTKGVRFDGASYTAWLAQFAASQDALKAFVELAMKEGIKNGKPLTELEIGQLEAKVKKAAADFQRSRIDQGQAVLCK
jgi:hypothetical protein